jgi:hypothetical protein
MRTVAIVGLVMLLNVAALAQIPSDTTLVIQITNRSQTGISGIVLNTQADVLYDFNINKTGQIGFPWVLKVGLK